MRDLGGGAALAHLRTEVDPELPGRVARLGEVLDTQDSPHAHVDAQKLLEGGHLWRRRLVAGRRIGRGAAAPVAAVPARLVGRWGGRPPGGAGGRALLPRRGRWLRPVPVGRAPPGGRRRTGSHPSAATVSATAPEAWKAAGALRSSAPPRRPGASAPAAAEPGRSRSERPASAAAPGSAERWPLSWGRDSA